MRREMIIAFMVGMFNSWCRIKDATMLLLLRKSSILLGTLHEEYDHI